MWKSRNDRRRRNSNNSSSIGHPQNRPLDTLSIVHFSFFFVVGLFVKDRFAFALLLGIGWEFVEHALVHYRPVRSLLVRYWPVAPRHWDEQIANKCADIAVNMCGYVLGNMVVVPGLS